MNIRDTTQNLLESLSSSIQEKFEERIKHACTIWGVNTEDLNEVKERCYIHVHGTKKHLIIDGYLVMVFTDWALDPFDHAEPLKVKASFECSEIRTPKEALKI